MNDEPRFILNRNPDDIDTLHRSPSQEACNLDDAKSRQNVDGETADALLEMGEAKRCQHCWT